MSDYSLGTFDFITFSQSPQEAIGPEVPMRQVQTIERPGVDGAEFMDLGIHGIEFWMLSVVDVDDLLAGQALLREYETLVGDGETHDIVWQGVSYLGAFDVGYKVLECRMVTCRRIAAASGGLSVGKGAILSARWRLFPVNAGG